MPKKNDDFFKEKKPWSKVKDELLEGYLEPYIQKVLYTRKPIVYVDCFAGKGMFEDGNPGSPIIALNTMRDCVKQTKMNSCNIQPFFIDLNYGDSLRENIKLIAHVENKRKSEILRSLIEEGIRSYSGQFKDKALGKGLTSKRIDDIVNILNKNISAQAQPAD
jgi:three-Cys-motif partner protein